MEYVIPAVLILLGLVNVNLIRVGIDVGEVQSRFFRIRRSNSAFGFWSAIGFQVFVSAVCFSVALLRITHPEF
ncbi:uncharacterized protein (DUF3084 family) [Desulfobaculum xiamenense]|uniref:Uncharacterized protein (DUF3084 family) n=1 Tax=Desulfobaculum xiamenense TaxID=995050 RepID=A0A846QKF8_9BACT|nr:hypothetical protein [Desulfobaculum xiamenense]NJB67627.1 uncharacterized protein (DUF3084 family) [Desulfobaculum xiamenense]